MRQRHLSDETITALQKIAELTKQAVEELRSLIDKLPIDLFPGAKLKMLLADVSAIPSDDAIEIGNVLLSLQMWLSESRSSRPIEDFVKDVVEAAQSTNPALYGGEDFIRRLSNNLYVLLSAPPLTCAQNATSLFLDRERILLGIRVLTDVRPVFESDPSTPPKSAMVVHSMKIAYGTSEGSEEVYVSFDDSDLDSIVAAFQRARAKANSIRKMLVTAKLNLIKTD